MIQAFTKDLALLDNKPDVEEVQAVRFCCKGWRSKALQVFHSKTDTTLYTVDTKFRKPNLIFKHDDDGGKFGSTTYHSTTNRIDLEINGQSTELKPTKILSSTYTYSSPAFGNVTMTWKSVSAWKQIDYVLLDERALPVARCSAPYFSADFSGQIEFLNTRASDQQGKEEILIGAMSLIYLTITIYYTAII